MKRYMVMHKVDARMEAGEPPLPGIIENMGRFIGRSIKAGIFKDGAGLHRSAQRARVTLQRGKPTVLRGPYAGQNELVARMALVSLPTGTPAIDRAIELATRLAEATGRPEVEVEVGPVVEGWDLRGAARPADAPHRFLLLVKGDAASEAGQPWSTGVRALLDEWRRDGVLQSEIELRPTAGARRGTVEGGKRRWTDGPFAESKELIAGFSVLEVPGLAEAQRFADEYGEILGDNQVDIRELDGA